MTDALKREDHPLSIENYDQEDRKPYIANEKEKDVVSTVFAKFRATADNRNQNFQYLGNRTITECINDWVGRFLATIDEREGIEDWQARAHVPMTADKARSILGKIVAMLPMAEVNGRFDDDHKRAAILDGLYQYSEDVDDYEELMICAALEAIIKGTVVGYEGYELVKSVKRDITGYEKDGSPKYKETTVTESKLKGSVVPLEQFYPSSVSIRKIEDMPYAFRRWTIPYSVFIDEYSSYERATLVDPKMVRDGSDGVEDEPFYQNFISLDVRDGEVEMICYFNKSTDEYVLLANGIWLNPMKDFTVAPNPFNHKRLPFWSARFDTIASDFFYGKSLVDRMQSMQDVLNVLTNMLLDQSFLTIFPPILTAGIDSIEDDYMRPGRRVPIDTQGLPLNQAMMKLDLGTPGGWHQFILEYTKRILEESSVDQVSSGQAGVGGRTTAEEIKAAAAGVASVLGLFGKLLNYGIKNKAMLRTANILQFWTDPKYPIVSDLLGDRSDSFSKAFNAVSVNGAKLSSGARGKRIVAMFPDTESFPTSSDVNTRAQLYKAETGQEVEIVAITPDYLRKIVYDIKMVPNLKSAETRDIQKALVLEKARVYMSFPLLAQDLDKKELQRQIAEVFGDDPDKMFPGNQQQTEQIPGQEVSQKPQGDVANNMQRQMMGGGVESMQGANIAR